MKLVIQGSHMVSGTRCPAWSDQQKKWSESRAAAPKGRCPVGHRGEFPCYSMGIFFFLVNFPYYLIRIIAFFFIFYLFSMLFNGDFCIFAFFVIVPCYSIGIFPFFQFLAIFHTIQWEFLYSSVFVNFPCYSIGISHIFNF